MAKMPWSAKRLPVLAAFAVALAASGAWAETAPAYLVVEISVHDQEGFSEYAEKASATIAQYGGTFIAMDGSPEAVEGEPPNGNAVLIQFPSVEQARAWLESPEYGAVKGIRHRTADTRQFLVEGLAPDQ